MTVTCNLTNLCQCNLTLISLPLNSERTLIWVKPKKGPRKMKLFSFYNVIWAICTALFLVQMTFIYIDYHQGKTGVGRSYEDETEMQLPCLTFCPLPAFRSNNFSVVALKTNLDVFKNLTYGQQDIFFNSSRKHSIVTKLLKRQPNHKTSVFFLMLSTYF